MILSAGSVLPRESMFNVEIEEQHMKAFSDNYNLENLLK